MIQTWTLEFPVTRCRVCTNVDVVLLWSLCVPCPGLLTYIFFQLLLAFEGHIEYRYCSSWTALHLSLAGSNKQTIPSATGPTESRGGVQLVIASRKQVSSRSANDDGSRGLR